MENELVALDLGAVLGLALARLCFCMVWNFQELVVFVCEAAYVRGCNLQALK